MMAHLLGLGMSKKRAKKFRLGQPFVPFLQAAEPPTAVAAPVPHEMPGTATQHPVARRTDLQYC